MLFRSATNADVPDIRELVFGVLREYGLIAEHQGVDADLDDIEGNYLARGGLFDLIFDDTKPHSAPMLIGTVGLYPQGEGIAELRKMYLRKSARGKGIGKRLLDRVLVRANELGFRRIELETSSKLIEAIGLYRRYGFQPFRPAHMACRCDQAFFLDLASSEPRPGAPGSVRADTA